MSKIRSIRHDECSTKIKHAHIKTHFNQQNQESKGAKKNKRDPMEQ